MKYWVFQNNQVLGPYDPEDLSRLVTFTAESLVCSEGRRGTSMGDWQRAGMVPDLSLSLVKAAQRGVVKNPVASLAGLPPEPTLKDLAVLGSLQEKMSMMEDALLQLQEGLRVKDSELAALHEDLARKAQEAEIFRRESGALRTESTMLKREAGELKQDADRLKGELDERKTEEAALRAETGIFKRKIGELEARIGAVSKLSETVDKAVEAEKHVEHDVETQGATLAALTKDIEALRAQLQERLSAAPPAASPAATPAPSPEPAAAPDITPPSLDSAPGFPPPSGGFPSAAPAAAPLPATAAFGIGAPPSVPAPAAEAAPAPAISLDLPAEPPALAPLPDLAPAPKPAPAPAPSEPGPASAPAFGIPASAPAEFGAAPAFGSASPESTLSLGGNAPGAMPSFDPLATAPVPVPEPGGPAAVVDMSSAPPPPSRKKGLLVGALLGLAAVGALVYFGGKMGLLKPKPVVDNTPLPPPPPVAPVAPAPDPRETAIAVAKSWALPDGKTLDETMAKIAPPSGNLSPWMADPIADGRVSVNYFAHGTAGAPTITYEFEVDTAAKSVIGRNAAAQTVLAGKAVPPPAPPKPKPVRIKPKAKAAPKPAPKPEDSLDSILDGESGPAKPADAAPAQAPAAPAEKKTVGIPGFGDADAPAPKPKAKGAKKQGKAADEALLDDVLKD